jgi:hypothetical protein
MNLSHGDEWPRLALRRGSGRQQRCFAIALHVGAKIVPGKAEIERPRAIDGCTTAWARGESVDQPRNTL